MRVFVRLAVEFLRFPAIDGIRKRCVCSDVPRRTPLARHPMRGASCHSGRASASAKNGPRTDAGGPREGRGGECVLHPFIRCGGRESDGEKVKSEKRQVKRCGAPAVRAGSGGAGGEESWVSGWLEWIRKSRFRFLGGAAFSRALTDGAREAKRQLGQLGTTLSRCAAPTGRRMGNGWKTCVSWGRGRPARGVLGDGETAENVHVLP